MKKGGRERKNATAKNNILIADVVVVGAGITGILTAYKLTQAGKKVVIFEKEKINSGATKDTTAFITQVIDTSLHDLIKMLGLAGAKKVMESHGEAINDIENIIKSENIECSFMRCSNYEYANTEKEYEYLEREYGAAKKLGVNVVLRKDSGFLGFENMGSLEFLNQAKFSASKFVAALSKILSKQGVDILENTEVLDVSAENIKAGKKIITKTEAEELRSGYVIIATYEPFNKPNSLYYKKAFYTSYVLEVEIPKGTIKEAIYEDVQDPYHYFRIDGGKTRDALIVGGEDHRSDIPVKESKNFSALKEYVKRLLSGVEYKIKSQWKGPILEPIDGLAFIGPIRDENILYAMAFSGNGMTYSSIASQIFLDIISDKSNKWLSIYRARRKLSVKSLLIKGRDFTEEFIGGAMKNIFRK